MEALSKETVYTVYRIELGVRADLQELVVVDDAVFGHSD
jgi:hypothetical protein